MIVHAITEKGRGFQPALDDEADQFHAVGRIDPVTGETVGGSSGGPAWTDVFAEELVADRRRARRRHRHDRRDAPPDRPAAVRAALPRPRLRRRHRRAARRRLGRRARLRRPAPRRRHLRDVHEPRVRPGADGCRAPPRRRHLRARPRRRDRPGRPEPPRHLGPRDAAARARTSASPCRATPRGCARSCARPSRSTTRRPSSASPRAPSAPTSPPSSASPTASTCSSAPTPQDVLIVGIGPMAHLAVDVAQRLRAQGIGATVIDPRWVVPVQPSVVELAASHRLVITIEDGIRVGGIGTRVRQVLREAGVDTAVDELGLPDEFIDHATPRADPRGCRPHGREDRPGRRLAGARHPDPGRRGRRRARSRRLDRVAPRSRRAPRRDGSADSKRPAAAKPEAVVAVRRLSAPMPLITGWWKVSPKTRSDAPSRSR